MKKFKGFNQDFRKEILRRLELEKTCEKLRAVHKKASAEYYRQNWRRMENYKLDRIDGLI